MVRAGAGTGKTTVLVERFVQAVLEDGDPVESVLAITFTEKAAAEMKGRVRKRFLELGRREEARAAEGAWISTIHGFCSRILRAHALTAGIDPEFRVLDELTAERLALDAFDAALEAFMADAAQPERIEMVAAYQPDKLRDMVRTVHSNLRSRGQRRPALDPVSPPSPAGELERLDRAARAALAELGAQASGRTVDTAIERVERCLGLLEAEDGGPPPVEELDGLDLKGNARAICGPACSGYREALAVARSHLLAVREARDHALLRSLLELYASEYEEGKRARSALDFEDLELIARDLLTDDGLREAYAGRFSNVLVDEFQDTNRLQNELLDQLSRDNLFRVGDENQSIYRFRNADVAVFRERWEEAGAAGAAESITVNFRSRGEILDAIDLTFERLWGESFEPLREAPDARAGEARLSPPVELIAVERRRRLWDEHFAGEEEPFGTALRDAQPWRAAEARLVAKRIDELTRNGPFEYRDVVLLFRATTAMSFFERALEERGIPTHVVGGRGYFAQQQVEDLRAWLAALANPLDELAVYSVLASPLAGLSLDAVALVGLHARRPGAWRTISEPREELLGALPEADRRRLVAVAERLEGERRIAGRVALETLIDRAVTSTGYDKHLLALRGGTRRMANVRKLMRLAREFEAERGRDLRAFVDMLADREAILSREGEAPLEAEAIKAVRMMTVHRAKGLEFPVVCVCDLGKEGRDDEGSIRVSEDGRVGLRLAGLGGSVDSETLERLKQEGKRAGEEEERRIFYVAATRACEGLILSGSTDLDTRPEPDDLREPMRWVWRGFCAGLPAEGAAGVVADEREGREVRVRWSRLTPETVDELLPAADRVPDAPPREPVAAAVQPPLDLGVAAAPRAFEVSRLSYSGLEAYRRCGYRFYLQRSLRMPSVERPPHAPPVMAAAVVDGLDPLLRGSAVHGLIETIDFARPELPTDEGVAAALERVGAPVSSAAVADLHGMVERLLASPLRERLASARRVRAELPFAYTVTPRDAGGRSLLINGIVDVLAEQEDGLLVVDWKSDVLGEADPEALVSSSYATQRAVYALAALRAGAPRVEVAHVFLERPEEPASAVYESAEASAVEAQLVKLASGIVAGRFEPADEPHAGLCADCPGRAALCSHEEELTLRAVP
jgi:ATP-dependent exoDNAse (exonuclease V) beta subunit